MRRVAFISFHTSPLDVPGTGDSGGLNVYVHDLAVQLSRSGIHSDVFTRRVDPATPSVHVVAPGTRVINVDAGPPVHLSKNRAAEHLEEFTRRVADLVHTGEHDLVHSHYWLSGLAALDIGLKLDIPVAHTSHTLRHVRAIPDGGHSRVVAEKRLATEADLLVANTVHDADALVGAYGADANNVEIIPPGVDHDVFAPRDRATARHATGFDAADLVVLYVGRIQRLKGADLATSSLLELSRSNPGIAERVTLVVAGGPSGEDGERTLAEMHNTAAHPEMRATVEFIEPRPHEELADLYGAADVCLVPSRSETFGLAALEAQACGVPVVATGVDGLVHVVAHGRSGLLVQSPRPVPIAQTLECLLADDLYRERLGKRASIEAARFSWGHTAASHCVAYGSLLSPDGIAVCG